MDSHEFAGRVEAMQGALYRVAYGLLLNRADCADAVQEALARAWEKRRSLREEAYFETWLTRILINECYSMLRRRKTTLPIDSLPEPAAPPDADPALHDAVARLDRKLRLPVVLHYMEGYPVRDIARMLRLPSGTVKTRLARARALLRIQLSDENDLSEGRKR
ncbi:MAG: sigma-70 family RNA polymerase sigma factor [Clostridia bacterium]|nr:sigma-70 family RNA polymerase sigma factor [Clostridia bacterium]